MELSARNQLTGTVQNVKSGTVMAEISVNVDAGQITAAITDSSRERLGLKDGDQASVIIKATEVMIATPSPASPSVAERPRAVGALRLGAAVASMYRRAAKNEPVGTSMRRLAPCYRLLARQRTLAARVRSPVTAPGAGGVAAWPDGECPADGDRGCPYRLCRTRGHADPGCAQPGRARDH